MSTSSEPVPANEPARLAAHEGFALLEAPGDPAFDAVVALAADMFDVSLAWIYLIDEGRQWFKAAQGVPFLPSDGDDDFCNHAITSGEMVVVEDALLDARTSRNRRVSEAPFIRFYAGVPIGAEPGIHLGTFCILDTGPRRFSSREIGQLRRLGEIAGGLLRQQRDARTVERQTRTLQEQTDALGRHATLVSRQKSLFDRASALTKMGAWEWTLETDELTWTDGMYDIHGIPRGSPMTPNQVLGFYPEGIRDRVKKLNARTTERRHYVFEAPLITGGGKRRWVRVTGSAERENGVIVRRFGVKQDVTEIRAIWDRMRFLAECDPLTGLANRSAFQKKLRAAIRDRRSGTEAIILLLIDVDGFKHVNDTFGHRTGDECLKQIAKRLRRACPGAELVARLGGDDFAILLKAADPEAATECALRLLRAVRRPVSGRDKSLQLSGSVGIAVSEPSQGGQTGDLFIEADLALYAAKAAGRNTFRLFAPAMKRKADERAETVRAIAEALAKNQLEVFYQPKIDLRDGNKPAGFEALLRWIRPDGQVIAAGAFTAALEDPSLSDRIGRWVIEAALDQAERWNRAGLDFDHIAINLSPSQFHDPDFADRLIGLIAARGLRPAMIEVEVTEGVFLSHESGVIKEILEALRNAGIRIALDDFGTGFASLSHLRTYPVDIIKIDRSFVRQFLISSQDHAIVESTLFLARHLKLDVVAEGIEEAGQCDYLRALGCRYGQGHFFARALCAADAAKWCASRAITAAPEGAVPPSGFARAEQERSRGRGRSVAMHRLAIASRGEFAEDEGSPGAG